MREILILVLLTSCRSSPKNPELLPLAPVEYQAVFAYAPRRAAELAETLLKDPKVRNCLNSEPEAQKPDFNAAMEGYLDYKGVMDSVNVAGPAGLKACLSRELSRLPFGRGRAGPFKMQLMQKKPSGQDLPS